VSPPYRVVTLSTTEGFTRAAADSGRISRARVPGRRLVEQLADRHGAKPRIGDVVQHVRVGQLLRFDQHVKRGRAREAVLAKWKLFHQVEHHQRGDALRVRRDLVDVPVAIGG
jgi:hypothetical protein